MSAILVNPKNKTELKFVTELLQKLGFNSKVLSDEEQEDLGLAVLMAVVDRAEIVTEDEILNKLQA
jgi:hypothetical protein